MNLEQDHYSSVNSPGQSFISYTELMRFAWRRRSFLALGIVIGLVLGALYYVQRPPLYEAEAQVLVVEKRPDMVTGQHISRSQIEDYTSTHRVLVKSPVIVERAIGRADLGSLQSLQDAEDLTTEIRERLTVSRVSREADSVLQLSFRGAYADECAVVVNAILESFQQFLAETYDEMNQDTVGLITQARDVLENDLRYKEKEYRKFREDSPLIWDGQDEVNPRQDRLAAIELQRSNLLLTKADLEGKLQTITKAKDDGRDQRHLVALVSDLAEDRFDPDAIALGEATLKSELLPLLLEEKRLMADYGPGHPYVEAVRDRIETTRNFFALPSASYFVASEEGSDTPAGEIKDDNLVDLYVDYLKNEIERIDTSEEILADLYVKEHEEARKLNGHEIRDEEFRNDITRAQTLYDSLIERLQDASLVKEYGGFEAQIIAPAGKGEKVAPRLSLVAVGSIFLGLVLGTGMAFVAELSDGSFRSADEVRQHLSLPIMGQVPAYAGSPTAATSTSDGIERDPLLCSYFHPRSSESEAFRTVRTALYFSDGGEDHKVIQVTSPNPGDGKSTVAANLAVSIAKSDKSVLLIDADMRKPRQHKIFGVASEHGLAGTIGLDIDPPDAICETGIKNLSLLPAGVIPPDPAELLTSPRFVELLDLLREQYDYVIIDSPPVLAVSDPSIVAARADGVLLTIRISKDGRSHAKRAKEALAAMNAHIVGVVVNAVESKGRYAYYDGGYGYGSSEYYQNAEDAQRLDAAAVAHAAD